MSAAPVPSPPVPPASRATQICEARLHDGRSYGIHLVDGLLQADALFAALFGHRRALLVAQSEVWARYGEQVLRLRARTGIDLRVLSLELDESRKTLDTVATVCAACHEHELGRTAALIALGGGVCSDIVTVAAGLVRRGIAHVRIPTTLIGQIDAGIGIKGGLNFDGAKSFLGTFEPPEIVLLDPAFLCTAPARSLSDGIAEAVKIALIADPRLFELLERHAPQLLRSAFAGDRALVHEVLTRSVARMIEQLSPNFFEDRTWQRRVDLGHTFSGLVEQRSGYEVSHGHAVAIDMALSAAIGVTLGATTVPVFERILRVLRAASLPTDSELLTGELCATAIDHASRHRGGTPNLVVPRRVGDCDFVTDRRQLTPAVFEQALARLRAVP
jgi:3-dehydroquinate synthase